MACKPSTHKSQGKNWVGKENHLFGKTYINLQIETSKEKKFVIQQRKKIK
jgi:hypothetical protein